MLLPHYIEPDDPPWFPNPRATDAEGLVAVGGALWVERLRLAYASGIFPWYDEGVPPLWWSPDPRATISPATLYIARSLRRSQRRKGFRTSWNLAFPAVMAACAEQRSDGTWILPEMITAYTELHEAGDAHSLEVWLNDDMVGGLYGVQRGALFAAESMFHRSTDASKIALVAAVQTVFAAGIELFDVQFATSHLASMGAIESSRDAYLERVARAVTGKVDLRAPTIVLDVE